MQVFQKLSIFIEKLIYRSNTLVLESYVKKKFEMQDLFSRLQMIKYQRSSSITIKL